MKLYKVINKDFKSMHGGVFDWMEYLPDAKGNSKWTPKVEVDMCNSGYHVTEYWNMWYEKDAHVFEVEVKGYFEFTDIGVCTKHVYPSIRLVKEIFPDFDEKSNTGDSNTGDRNTGDCNTGHYNTGHWNTGNSNTGDYNTGNSNTGDRNTGNSNTGDRNTGNRNTGDRNTGNRNTGDRNTGDSNTGHWNTCNYSTGAFNTKQEDTIKAFNKECSRIVWDNAQKPSFLYFSQNPNESYKEAFQRAYRGASKEEHDMLKALPNFDANVFFEISGIKVED